VAELTRCRTLHRPPLARPLFPPTHQGRPKNSLTIIDLYPAAAERWRIFRSVSALVNEFSGALGETASGGDAACRWCERSELGFGIACCACRRRPRKNRNWKSMAPREGRGTALVPYVEINGAALNLAAYRARLSDLSRRSADFSLGPGTVSGVTLRRFRRQTSRGSLRQFALTVQLLHAGTYGREVVCTTRSVHDVSSHALG